MKVLKKTLLILFVFSAVSSYAELSVRVRDLSFIDGLKDNQIFGYGVVTGLSGTGDSKCPLSGESLQNFIRNMGIEPENFKSRNIAAVLITAKLDPFVRTGDKIDVTVSSIGDAKSLEGGILIQSPLCGANGRIYAAAQGRLEIPEPSQRNSRLSAVKTSRPVKTVARVTGGGIVERDITPDIVSRNEVLDKEWIFLVLKDWDYGVADRIIKAVAEKYPQAEPAMTFSGKIQLTLPKDTPVQEFIDGVQQLEVTPADRPLVVINHQDGTVVAGGHVLVTEAFVSRAGMVLEIDGTGENRSAVQLEEATTIKDLVDTLNAAGAGTADIIAIMKALKDAGAIHAELIIQ